MEGRIGESRYIEQLGSELPISAKLVISYLEFEHLINNKPHVTFHEIVAGTGLSARTVRKVLGELRSRGIVEAILDVGRGRRHLYRLSFKNLIDDSYGLPVGLYLVDVGVGTLPSMTFKIYRVLRQSGMALHTDTVPPRLLELTKCTCVISRLLDHDPGSFANMVATVVENGAIASVIMDSLLDWALVRPYVESVTKALPSVRIFHVGGPSPIQVAIEMLMVGLRDKVVFRRGDLIIEVLVNGEVPRVPVDKLLKAYVVQWTGESFLVRELAPNQGPGLGFEGSLAYVVYSRY